ncbi:hypothetical protein H0H81_009523, partial [Sphagnurus paluster]
EIDPKTKTVDRLFFELNTFERYCSGELGTANRPKKIEIFNPQKERLRIEERDRLLLQKYEEQRALASRRAEEENENGNRHEDQDEGQPKIVYLKEKKKKCVAFPLSY